jgi:hypothetical protein
MAFDPDKYVTAVPPMYGEDGTAPPWFPNGDKVGLLPPHGTDFDPWGEKGPTGTATTQAPPTSAPSSPPVADYNPAAANGAYGGKPNMLISHGLLNHRFSDGNPLVMPYLYDVTHAYDSFEFDWEQGTP